MLIIGNIISFGAAIFTAAASAARDNSRIYYLQVCQCGLLAVASFFFHSYAGITTLVLCALRGVLCARGKFNLKISILFMVLVAALGFSFNNRGWVGALPIVATLIYTLWAVYAKEERSIKWNISINLIIWIIYEIFILDISSLVADVICLIIAFVALVRLHRENNAKKKS